MMTTNQITAKYGITRQTLNNWVQKKYIPSPKMKRGHQNVWTSSQLKLIDKRVAHKNIRQLNLFDVDLKPLHINNRRYLGCKQRMLNFINRTVSENTTNVKTVADIFAGTGVVANLFRAQGKKVIVNDILTSNYITYETWFGNEEVDISKIKRILSKLNSLKGVEGYVTKNFGNRYFSIENAKKIDAIREKIEVLKNVNKRERSFLLTSLLYAMDKVSNTVGHFDSYRKHMDSYRPIYLRCPDLNINGENEIYNEDANKLVKKVKADLVYIDTPYNSRGYESMYHVLENVMEWKKPAVEGVAKKAINRKEKSSDYTTSKAPQAFSDLISNINARYILVSYNNMAKKGNSRSNAKISNEEIIDILKKRGEVKVFSTDFNAFTTGKSKISNHKELLYLCIVDTKYDQVIQSPLNYTGAKHKVLPQIKPLFPKKYSRFIDLFVGGGSVTANLISDNIADLYIMNDIEPHIMDFFKFLAKTNINDFIKNVESRIKEYKLSNSKLNGYEFYGCDSAKGLSKFNKKGFLKLRSDYNANPNSLEFYLLIVFGFNNQVRFNSKGEYNLPVGKRDFNQKMQDKLVDFSRILKNPKLYFSSKDFRQIKFKKDDFIYADPPYLISEATYNENSGWTEKDEVDLYNYLDRADKAGVRFALSNVILHKNLENKILEKWSAKYNLNVIDHNYNNSNYQTSAGRSRTVEVLVTNYN
ncbi:Dam family site-specific DNA-(adenine-N6)-methyltransferase [Lactobacillus sp. ESL0791]|uniref:Dam family site-specific DNA-(adenine-N6)-methyltransferase n=1 Tax=Lactobacillus sp. ESL0791 TaxID=2983234 RepID=UPI0023F67CB3|nr:Dam family site-specific DNA-(adenine-N6)-methyltransferase [Lactobacillus sp. ESL0791]MDF7638461.1 Dam family site-specific DNA-(adenine-N6)-methyltransferase [Lactobacillus sp. ESL0791]